VGDLGRLLVVLGLVMLVAGLLVIALGRAHPPLGRLPGDLVYRGKNTTIYFPIVTSVLLSLALSAVFYLINLFRR
jgi:hypothetical protein